ncbi:MAG: hypothetical protein WC933_02735 [Candidatus Paceibacterota bacterium]|jgi:late competence protein required for DNA uptake (superfamily II DNA/RNA helicase)
MDYTKTTLGELLSSENETIKRNAVSILKVLQKRKIKCEKCGRIDKKLLQDLASNAWLCEECFDESIITETGLSKNEMRKV